MSDKSKLGFNINPKNYDELNSTDNLITSGSDSGWLGKKLQGDNNSTIDLSKINPLFDKELYEKYRPGVNTNDGSVNQDIWGYKCFNSPVSFRNGIYGDTYSITEQKSSGETIDLAPETYATIKSDTTVKNKIYNRTENDANNYSEYTYKKYHGPIDYDNSQFTYFENVFPDNNDHIISDSNIKRHIESHNNDLFATNDISERTLCSVIPKVHIGTTSEGADAQYVYSVNYTSTQYERKLQAYTPKIDYKIISESGNEYIADEIKEENATAILRMSAESPYRNEQGNIHKLGSSILLETSSEQHDSTTYINQLASIEICSPQHCYYATESYVDISAKKDGSIGSINITPGYMRLISETNSSAPYISISGSDNSITLFAGKLNLPSTIVTHASALSKEINSANYIYATDNSILPSNDSVISLGSNSYKYSNIYADRLIGIASAAEKLVYVNPASNAETELLTVSNENLILPRGNQTIQLGRTDNRFGTIYGDLNGTAVLAEHADTAKYATKDQDGNIIKSSYLNILDFGRNDIESYNAIIGNEKEGLLFLKERYFDYNSAIPPINKSYSSIQCSFIGNTTSYTTNITWSNEDEDKPIIKTCHVAYKLIYDKNKANFYIVPNGVGSNDPAEHVESMNIGAPDAHWDSIYCDKFPTIHKTIGGYLVGSIRLLCIKTPATSIVGREAQIYPGDTFGTSIEVLSSNTGTGTLTCTVSHAVFKVTGESAMHLEPTTTPMLEGTWQALCGVHIVIGKSITYIPVLAIRVK